jgi:hypothetical protein
MIPNKNVYTFASLFIISVSAICYQFVNRSKNELSNCEIQSRTCTLSQGNGEIRIEFLTPIKTEEEILLSITVPKAITIETAWVEGVNMYMGKTPLIQENSHYTTFLGSCNLATMKWQLNIQTRNKNGHVQTYSATFHTSNN